jgi:hypothetical protein
MMIINVILIEFLFTSLIFEYAGCMIILDRNSNKYKQLKIENSLLKLSQLLLK